MHIPPTVNKNAGLHRRKRYPEIYGAKRFSRNPAAKEATRHPSRGPREPTVSPSRPPIFSVLFALRNQPPRAKRQRLESGSPSLFLQFSRSFLLPLFLSPSFFFSVSLYLALSGPSGAEAARAVQPEHRQSSLPLLLLLFLFSTTTLALSLSRSPPRLRPPPSRSKIRPLCTPSGFHSRHRRRRSSSSSPSRHRRRHRHFTRKPER